MLDTLFPNNSFIVLVSTLYNFSIILTKFITFIMLA